MQIYAVCILCCQERQHQPHWLPAFFFSFIATFEWRHNYEVLLSVWGALQFVVNVALVWFQRQNGKLREMAHLLRKSRKNIQVLHLAVPQGEWKVHGKALCQAVQMQRKILSSSSITRENSLYQAVQTQGKTPCIKQFKCKGKLPASSSSNTRKNSLYQVVQAQGKTPRIKLFKCRGKKNARENSLYQAVQTLGKTPCIKQFKH